jgi:hypothetical protein
MTDFGRGIKLMLIVYAIGCALAGAAAVGVVWLGVSLL